MNWLILAFALQLGYTPNDYMVQYQPPPRLCSTEAALNISMDAELRAWHTLYVGGSFGVPVWITSGDGYTPFSGWPQALQSVVRAGIRFGGIEIGWSHLCSHPVMPYQPLFQNQTIWEGGYDEFHVKFSGEVHF